MNDCGRDCLVCLVREYAAESPRAQVLLAQLRDELTVARYAHEYPERAALRDRRRRRQDVLSGSVHWPAIDDVLRDGPQRLVTIALAVYGDTANKRDRLRRIRTTGHLMVDCHDAQLVVRPRYGWYALPGRTFGLTDGRSELRQFLADGQPKTMRQLCLLVDRTRQTVTRWIAELRAQGGDGVCEEQIILRGKAAKRWWIERTAREAVA